ncbi:MAG: ATP-binding protein [Thermodesulfobacteriota bacterium]
MAIPLSLPKYFKNLRFKIIAGLVVTLTVTMTFLFYIQYHQHKKKMINALRDHISPNLTEVIKKVLRDAMMSRNLGETEKIFKTIIELQDVKNIFLMNKVGEVIVSPRSGDIGVKLDVEHPTCQVCHRRKTEILNKTVIFTSDEGGRIFRNVNPILNRKACHGCHDPNEKIIGVLVTDFSLTPIEDQLAREFKGNIFFLVLFILIAIFVVSFTMNRLVISKVEKFVEAAKRFGQGDLTQRIVFKADDELKRLAESFNQMAGELKKKMKQEKQYISRIIDAQEGERRRISRELHDELGGALTAIKYNLEIIERDLPEDLSDGKERLKEVEALSTQILGQLRTLSHDLRPPMLDDLGLLPTLRWYIENYGKRCKIKTHYEAIGFPEKVDPELETTLYRVIQEALTNIAKHARADDVHVHLSSTDLAITVTITDNGAGFDPQEVSTLDTQKRGFGIMGMQERVSSLGGRIDIRSRQGAGTQITIEIPLKSSEGEDEPAKDKSSDR